MNYVMSCSLHTTRCNASGIDVILYTLNCITVYNVRSTVYNSVHSTIVYSVQCRVYTVWYNVYCVSCSYPVCSMKWGLVLHGVGISGLPSWTPHNMTPVITGNYYYYYRQEFWVSLTADLQNLNLRNKQNSDFILLRN